MWGKFKILLDSSEAKVKRIFVDPYKSLSYQFHKHRSEHWIVVTSKAEVMLDGINTYPYIGESIVVPKGMKHSLSNNTNEVRYGNYFGEDDIIRITNLYDR
ncbi:phosphomannose isomerase type II C-terminal cupin domain [bacterium]|nr:phosphomannose isomerase type II C-terminal cupin domain [bacterium]